MANSTDIINALKWWNADRFKSQQRKLTTARNTIEKEAGLVNGEWQDQVLKDEVTKALIDRFDTEIVIKQSDSVHRL